MSEINEEIPNKTVIVDSPDQNNQKEFISINCSEEASATRSTETTVTNACSKVEEPVFCIQQVTENGDESKSENTTDTCSSSTFESTTNSVCVSNDSTPSRNDNNNQLTSQPLNSKEENKKSNVPKAEQIKINASLNSNSDTNLDPALIHSSSTVSLQETRNVITLSKAGYSKSADNVSTVHNIETSSSNSLDTEKILSEFSSQKTKVTATQKISQEPETVESLRLPKETLSQDLGSIVKNVHGIFSSVSGTIKNAYNISNNYRTQKPTKPIKVIPNNRILNDIFDEDVQDNSSTDNVKQECVGTEVTELSEVSKEGLEKILAEQRKEMVSLKEKVKLQSEEMQAKEQMFKGMEGKMEAMRKSLEHAEREKDAAVMRYAGGERAIIEARRAADSAARAEKCALAELELVSGKLKSAHAEKQRICRMYDDKCHELLASEREVAKLREDAKEIEGRLKWTQSKLRMEMDAYKESAEKVERLEKKVSELEAGREAAASGAADALRAKQLESELKESQAALILCRHEKEELERRVATAANSLRACEEERDSASAALSLANQELTQVREASLRLEEENSQLASLRAHAALAHSLSTQLQRESERASQAEEALGRERARAETCGAREAQALQHAARLTAERVAARAQASDCRAREQALTVDNSSLRERVSSLEAECARLRAARAEEAELRRKETRTLARKVAEVSAEAAAARQQLEWQQGENCVLQKKHASATKELNRELQRALKRCDQLEAKLPPERDGSADTRTGSVSSLSSGEGAPERLQNGHAAPAEASTEQWTPSAREPDRQALVERIVSLQRAAARRAERCEFLEEHCRALTAACRDKTRLLRGALCAAAPPLAPTDTQRDIARLGGGAMAAVWGGDPADLPRDLALEMTRRLQASLEDALLKNICLKENVDTLGKEIARLKSAAATDSTSK